MPMSAAITCRCSPFSNRCFITGDAFGRVTAQASKRQIFHDVQAAGSDRVYVVARELGRIVLAAVNTRTVLTNKLRHHGWLYPVPGTRGPVLHFPFFVPFVYGFSLGIGNGFGAGFLVPFMVIPLNNKAQPHWLGHRA